MDSRCSVTILVCGKAIDCGAAGSRRAVGGGRAADSAAATAEPKRARPGWPRVPDRAALAGIVFVLDTGIGWNDLPTEVGCGSGVTC